MDVKRYLKIRDLFQTKWDPAILDVVSRGPYRFGVLARQVRETVDPSLADCNVTRSLARLQEIGLIQNTTGEQDGRPCQVYQVTPSGQETLTAYQLILGAYPHCG